MNKLEALVAEKGVAKDYCERARLILGELGVSIKPASFRDVYRIASRDTKGCVVNYDINFSGDGRGLRRWVIEANGVEMGYYVTEIFEDKNTGKSIGEVRAVRLASALRGRGIGSLFFFLGHMELLEEGIDSLRAVVGDESGKIVGLLKKFRYKETDKRVEASECPVWEKTDFNGKRELLLDFLYLEFCRRTEGFRRSTLHFDPADVDIDNPFRVSVKNTVIERLKVNGGSFLGESRFVFGYHYGQVSIVQENLANGQTRFVLQVEGGDEADKDILRAILSESFPGQMVEIYSCNILSNGSLPRWEVESFPAGNSGEIMESAQKLAQAGETFFHRVRVEQSN